MSKNNPYTLPNVIYKNDGSLRLVGIEIEMSGIELFEIVKLYNNAFGGKIEKISKYEVFIKNSKLGDAKVELDLEYLKNLEKHKNKYRQSDYEIDSLLDLSDAFGALAKNIIPCEFISPPIPFKSLNSLDSFINLLKKYGAKGTNNSALFAFGVHYNPELPDINAKTIINYMKAFFCLQDWLEVQEKANITRKITPFIDNFSSEYIKIILQKDYCPEISELIKDYLKYNSTRNRILDMLPLFAYLNEELVTKAIPDEKIKPRPTLHYRLPNSDIDNNKWGLWQSWNNWVQVELLANDAERLEKICKEYLRHHKYFFLKYISKWQNKVKKWLIDL